MKRYLAIAILVCAQAASADVPKLDKVDTQKSPLKLSAPVGWEVHTTAPEHKDLATIGGISPRCPTVDISVTIQLDQIMTKPSQLLAEQYHGVKSTKLHGWDCIEQDVHTEVMCAGTVKGLAGVVDVYFATTDPAAFKRFGPPMEFTAQIAASISWQGKVADLADWERAATDDAKASCK